MCLFAHKNSNGVDIKKLEPNYEQNKDIVLNNDFMVNDRNYLMNYENYDKFSNVNNYNINSIPVKTCYNVNEQFIPIIKSNVNNRIHFSDKANSQYYNPKLMSYLNKNEHNVDDKFYYSNNNNTNNNDNKSNNNNDNKISIPTTITISNDNTSNDNNN